MSNEIPADMPPRMADLKRTIGPGDADAQARFVGAWNELLGALKARNAEIKEKGSDVRITLACMYVMIVKVGYTQIVPQVDFADLQTISPEVVAEMKRRGCVLIRNVVADADAVAWRKALQAYVSTNEVEGLPEEDKQFFQL